MVCSRHLSSIIDTPQTRATRQEPPPKQVRQHPKHSGHPHRTQGTVGSGRMGLGRGHRPPEEISRAVPAASQAPLVRVASRQEPAMLLLQNPLLQNHSRSDMAGVICETRHCPILFPAISPRSIDRPCALSSCARSSMDRYARRHLTRSRQSECWR